MGIERSTFIFHNKTLVKSYRKVKAAGHAEQVLEDLKALQTAISLSNKSGFKTRFLHVQKLLIYFNLAYDKNIKIIRTQALL